MRLIQYYVTLGKINGIRFRMDNFMQIQYCPSTNLEHYSRNFVDTVGKFWHTLLYTKNIYIYSMFKFNFKSIVVVWNTENYTFVQLFIQTRKNVNQRITCITLK